MGWTQAKLTADCFEFDSDAVAKRCCDFVTAGQVVVSLQGYRDNDFGKCRELIAEK